MLIRLARVQDQLRRVIADAPPGPIKIISVCAGQGHDVVATLGDSPRRAAVRARLVEGDERNVAEARRKVAEAGLAGIEVCHGDAGLTDAYAGAVPARILLLCGVFGSLTDTDIDRLVAGLPQLCQANAQVIWTANRTAPELYAEAEQAFRRYGFEPRWADPEDHFGVTRHELVGEPQPLQPGRRLFDFADEQTLIKLGRIAI
ncbi:class I SAM-dependent methyltransferase family protein [Microlunatus parietis]|uniref:Methyltransferase domain-containing protein n=1 Tax=Microlunatus parietis TaxID=682979 RepID=A0A7Y9I9V3_9ACTN|nr:class I SAM-dependent methyltransferase family protein [Microlunatus parietis]NYE72939.1 hypothetical protein [Microlunatus parietis]